jgi:hypothetical protein
MGLEFIDTPDKQQEAYKAMKQNQEQLVIIGAALVGAGWLLTRNPNCSQGCQTVAQHLLNHGIDDLLTGLFA